MMKSTDRILAQRYGRAFDRLSQTVPAAQAAYAALSAAAEALRPAAAFMQNPSVSVEEKTAFVQEAFGKETQTARFIGVLLAAKRYYLLDACVQEIGHLADERAGVQRAVVQTAYALPDAQQQRVRQALEKWTQKSVAVRFEQQPELLGGLRVRLGDRLIDGSWKKQFEKLAEQLTK